MHNQFEINDRDLADVNGGNWGVYLLIADAVIDFARGFQQGWNEQMAAQANLPK